MFRQAPKTPKAAQKSANKISFLPTSDAFFKQLRFLIFVFGLFIIYIFNTHKASSNRLKMEKLQEDIKYLRGEHTALKAQTVDLFRHSVLLNEVKKLDLDYSKEPLKIIDYDKTKL